MKMKKNELQLTLDEMIQNLELLKEQEPEAFAELSQYFLENLMEKSNSLTDGEIWDKQAVVDFLRSFEEEMTERYNERIDQIKARIQNLLIDSPIANNYFSASENNNGDLFSLFHESVNRLDRKMEEKFSEMENLQKSLYGMAGQSRQESMESLLKSESKGIADSARRLKRKKEAENV